MGAASPDRILASAAIMLTMPSNSRVNTLSVGFRTVDTDGVMLTNLVSLVWKGSDVPSKRMVAFPISAAPLFFGGFILPSCEFHIVTVAAHQAVAAFNNCLVIVVVVEREWGGRFDQGIFAFGCVEVEYLIGNEHFGVFLQIVRLNEDSSPLFRRPVPRRSQGLNMLLQMYHISLSHRLSGRCRRLIQVRGALRLCPVSLLPLRVWQRYMCRCSPLQG